jgi:uncharacterized protein (UPF0276 family)
MVVHGVELSIGSAHGWNQAYIDMLDTFHAEWPFLWHSEHLGFQIIPGSDGTVLEVGVPLPVPPTREAVEIIGNRASVVCQRYGKPFLLENPAYYIKDLPADDEIGDDIGLVKAIMDRSGCYLLLDLHNIYCNSVNHGIDPYATIDRALSRSTWRAALPATASGWTGITAAYPNPSGICSTTRCGELPQWVEFCLKCSTISR